MRLNFTTLGLLLLLCSAANAQSRYRLTGYVRAAQTDKPIAGASILLLDVGLGTVTDTAGFFSLPLPKGLQTVQVTHTGFATLQRTSTVRADESVVYQLVERITLLTEAIVTAGGPGQNVQRTAGGITSLSIRTLRQLPTLLGEVDVLRTVQFLPGVSNVGEASSGFNVRGGNADQNLILLDDAPLFNAAHLLGFISVFNPDVLQDVNFYRGVAPANVGGRAASVLQTRLKEARATTFGGAGGVGLLSSRLKIEGPLVGNKLAFYVATRLAYPDQLLRLFPIQELAGVRAGFTDLVFRTDYLPNPKNKFSLTLFTSNDRFRLPATALKAIELEGTRSEFNWQTQLVSLAWSRYLSARWQLQTSAALSRYTSTITTLDTARAYRLKTGIDYKQAKAGFSYTNGAALQAELGLSGIQYDITAGQLAPNHPNSQVNPVSLPNQRAVEAGLYGQADIILSARWSAQMGIRYSWFGQLGPATTYRYRPGAARSPETIADSVQTPAGQLAQTYGGIEPRLSLRWALGRRASIKVGVSRMIQYLQQLANTTAALPADRWQTADAYLKPQVADQASIGYFQNLRDDAVEISVEVFYKRLTNVTDYRDGTSLLLNPYPETAVLQGTGFARGLELYIRKNAGLLTGWISYTYSQTRFLVDSPFAESSVNKGAYYPAAYDKPHILNVVLNYKISPRLSVSANGVYTSGRPITYPYAKLYVGNRVVPYFTGRNQDRLPDYLRFDAGLTISGVRASQQPGSKHRVESDVNLSLYNLLGRRNAYSVFVQTPSESGQYYNGVNAYKLSVLGAIIPSISYNVRF